MEGAGVTKEEPLFLHKRPDPNINGSKNYILTCRKFAKELEKLVCKVSEGNLPQ